MRRIMILALGALVIAAAPGSVVGGAIIVGLRRWRQRNLVQVIYPRLVAVHTRRVTLTVCR